MAGAASTVTLAGNALSRRTAGGYPFATLTSSEIAAVAAPALVAAVFVVSRTKH
jgi:hypothetical protein